MTCLRFGALAAWCVAIAACLVAQKVNAQTVWSGYTHDFAKFDFADINDPDNQDRITDNVWITRSTNAGIFNIHDEPSYIFDESPGDTEWATGVLSANFGETIEATNWEDLTFADWRTAYGGMSGLASNILFFPAVVHLISDDVYLDLQFTAWTIGGGGGFAYSRAEGDLPSPAPTGDYNNDGTVDAADYVVWRRTMGQTVPEGTGADGNESGTIDPGDYDYWRARFGNNVSGAATAAPEPGAAAFLIALIAAASALRRRATAP